MWFLISHNDPRVLYVVPQKRAVLLGRLTEAHIFANLLDRSISRKHAFLILTRQGLFVIDLGSKYGTYINNAAETLEANRGVKLNNNDIVTFGKLGWKWQVHEFYLITCTSKLNGEQLMTVYRIIGKIGGKFTNEWHENCSFLTTSVITLTIKVMLALIQGSHIVTVQFWHACLYDISINDKLSHPQAYLPEIEDSAINNKEVSFSPNPKRKTIFANKKFVFFTKKYYVMYKQVLIKSGAEPLLLDVYKLTKSMLHDKDVIVIQNMSFVESQSQREKINDIVSYLKSKGKRVVGHSEIGLAILYCCIDKYCNPDFCFPIEITKQTLEANSSTILAQESQKPTTPTKNENIVNNESLSDEKDLNKGKLCEITDGIETNVNKKIAGVTSCTEIENVNKRRFDEDSDSSDITSKKIAVNASESEDIIQLNDKHFENKCRSASNIDVSAMKGVKLQELLNSTNFETNHPAKEKEFSECDKRTHELSLGTTVVTVNADLIVKKQIHEIDDKIPQCRNFKKFKKVWPMKMQNKI